MRYIVANVLSSRKDSVEQVWREVTAPLGEAAAPLVRDTAISLIEAHNEASGYQTNHIHSWSYR